MATVTQVFEARNGEPRSTAFAPLVKANGTEIPVTGLAFDAAADLAVFFRLRAARYGSGNVTVAIDWYADTATTGDVVWGAQLAAITADADTQDIETDSLATAATVTDSHLGTTGQRLHRASITITSLDSLAADDDVAIRVFRDADNAADTMAGNAIATRVTVSYSDT